MQTVLEVLNKTKDFFEQKEIENPRVNAEWLLAKGLGCKRLDLYLKFDNVLSEEQLSSLRELVRRRANREPLQYILGEMPFMDIHLKVDPRALIPRPETEQLVELLLDFWGDNQPHKILDLGTGTGALALALAHYCEDSIVVGVDINPQSIELARENAKLNNLETRVAFVQSNWFDKLEGKFNCIISNPPYLTNQEYDTAQPEIKDHEPKIALVSEEDGLSDLKTILTKAKDYLAPKGTIALETGIAHHEALTTIANDLEYSNILTKKDTNGKDRFFIAKFY